MTPKILTFMSKNYSELILF